MSIAADLFETESPRPIALNLLDDHPLNPRLIERTDVVEAIKAQITDRFDPAHAVLVRPIDGGRYQIVSGHNRAKAARAAGLSDIPAWVRVLDDDAAYMLLATSNAQSELSPLENGIHALRVIQKHDRGGLAIRTYARKVGRPEASVTKEVNAAEVYYEALDAHVGAFDGTPEDQMEFLEKLADQAPGKWRNLAEIYPAPVCDRPALVKRMIEGKWTVEETRSEVTRFRKHTPPNETVTKLSRHDHISLEQWYKLDKTTQTALLHPKPSARATPSFNKQTGPDIEWAMHSFNVITGCEHTCPYCYARQIANSSSMAAVYPYGFAPTLHPRRLLAPRSMKVPDEAAQDGRWRNVFLGSMADMFGRWVPSEWIDAVLDMIAEAPEWNFLCLTKFPKRMAEFDIPANAWMGTTVDLQARVTAAEAAFANVGAAVKWLSCEPLIEPLRFKHLDRFHWIVIGGASATDKTPDWQPPFEWIADLVHQARDAGLKVYFKTNLLQPWQWDRPLPARRIIELPFDAPIAASPIEAPAVFHYLDRTKSAAA